MQRCGVGVFVFSSTCATYAPTDSAAIAEDTPQQPSNPYGSTKLMIERMIADCCSADGLRWSALRYVERLVADPRRAELILGFRTRWSLEEAIRTAWNWHLAETGRPAGAMARIPSAPAVEIRP